MLDERMSELAHAEISVLVDILYHPEDVFHQSSISTSRSFDREFFMQKYARLVHAVCFYVCSTVFL